MDNKEKAVLRTILYADIFDYALSFEQLWYFILSPRKISKKEVIFALSNLDKYIIERGGYYLLSNRRKLLAQSSKKRSESQRKIEIAQKAARILSKVPAVNYIGISGSLAMENAKSDDDIDFFLIVEKETLWLSRLCCLLILTFLGRRRKRIGKQIKNTICLNMMIDTTALSLSKSRRTIYSAHEITQLATLYNKNNTYEQFLSENTWIKKILSNAAEDFSVSNFSKDATTWQKPLEYFAKKIQLFFINRHRTTETIGDHFLAFHPFDYGDWVEKEYKKRLKKYEI